MVRLAAEVEGWSTSKTTATSGHGGDPVGACVEPGSEYDHLLGARAEGQFGLVIDEARAGDS